MILANNNPPASRLRRASLMAAALVMTGLAMPYMVRDRRLAEGLRTIGLFAGVTVGVTHIANPWIEGA